MDRNSKQLVANQGAATPDMSSRFDKRFILFVILIAALAAAASSIVAFFALKMWVMFLAWTAFGLGNGSIKGGLFAIISMIVGVIIAMITIIGFTALQPHTPSFALAIAVFIAVVVVMGMSFTRPVDNIPACFLGLSAYFGSQMAPNFNTFADLGAAIVLGAVAAALVVPLDRLCKENGRLAA